MRPAQFRPRGATIRLLMSCGLALLTACASPPSRFYTLGSDSESTPASRAASPAFLVDVLPVKVPAIVTRSQLVVQVSATQVNVLEDDRWASPLADQIHDALTMAVSRQSGALDVHGMARAADLPVYRVSVDIRRFESWPRSHVLVDAVWTVRAPDSEETMTCHSVVTRAVPEGYDAIVVGHRQALESIAAQIAEGVREWVATPAVRQPTRTTPSGTAKGARRFCPA